MAFVTRYGNTISEAGWRMVDEAECEWSVIPGSNAVSVQLRKGVPTTILVAFLARFNKIIEPLRDADTGGWTLVNDVGTSNHLAGCAVDANWSSHPFHVAGTYGDKLGALRELLDSFGGSVFWGGDWSDPIDEMHFQMGWPEGDKRYDAVISSLLGAVPEPTEPVDNRTRYARAIIAEGQRRGISERGIEIALATALVESNLTMYANSSVPQSLNMPHEAVGSDHDSVGLFQQRCPMWGPVEILMDATQSAGLFYDKLVNLEDDNGNHDDYNDTSESPGFYAYRVQRCAEEYAYRYDERFDDAVALYNSNVFKQKDEGFLMALSDAQQQEIYDALCGQRGSRSPLHRPGEGTIGNIEDLEANTDGSVHILVQYLLGVILRSPRTLEELRAVASTDDPKQSGGRQIAQAMLNLIDLHDQAPGPNVVVAQAPITPASSPVVLQPIASNPQTSAVVPGGTLGDDFGKLHTQLSSLTEALGELSTAFVGKK
jgi:hypothetical protein